MCYFLVTMKIIDKKYIENNEKNIIQEILAGKVFVYPTDTIYGLGADATNDSAVLKIREIKKRETKPFSIIAPGIKWTKENYDVSSKKAKEALCKLPGPYTLFLNMTNDKARSEYVNPEGHYNGVRIPDNWFTKIIEKTGKPFVTTSVNLAGEPYMQKIEDLNDEIANKVDYVIYDGELSGKPSIKIDICGK